MLSSIQPRAMTSSFSYRASLFWTRLLQSQDQCVAGVEWVQIAATVPSAMMYKDETAMFDGEPGNGGVLT